MLVHVSAGEVALPAALVSSRRLEITASGADVSTARLVVTD